MVALAIGITHSLRKVAALGLDKRLPIEMEALKGQLEDPAVRPIEDLVRALDTSIPDPVRDYDATCPRFMDHPSPRDVVVETPIGSEDEKDVDKSVK